MRRVDDVVFEVVEGRAVLVRPDGTELITLNPVGTMVWEALAQPRDPGALADELNGRFGAVGREALERDCAEFVAQLRELGLVVADDAHG